MSEITEFKLRAYHLTDGIDIKACKERVASGLITESKTELFYEFDYGKFVLIFNYGVIVFYDFNEEEIFKTLNQFFPDIQKSILLSDEFGLSINPLTDITMAFNSLSLKIVNTDVIRIVMLNLAQSLAILYYDQVSQDLLAKVKQFTTQMEETGTLKISRKNIMRFIGKALNSKNRIAENLYIFDAPPITWNNEYLDQVNTTLSKHFDLGPRYRSIESTFDIVESNLSNFLGVSHHKESSKLEWIIIILILVEVLDTFVTKIL